MSEMDDIADDISTVRHAMKEIIEGNDRLDTGPKTQMAIVQTLDLLSRIVEEMRRIDGQGVDGADYASTLPTTGTIDTRISTHREDDLDGGKPVTLR